MKIFSSIWAALNRQTEVTVMLVKHAADLVNYSKLLNSGSIHGIDLHSAVHILHATGDKKLGWRPGNEQLNNIFNHHSSMVVVRNCSIQPLRLRGLWRNHCRAEMKYSLRNMSTSIVKVLSDKPVRSGIAIAL